MFVAVELYHKERSVSTLDPSHGKSLMLQHPWIIAFLFGLLHGFGFAGAPADIGLPEDTAIWALFSFNVGVELGQLIIVVGLLSVFAVYKRCDWQWHETFRSLPIYGIGTIAAFWFIERSLKVLSLADQI